MRSATRIVAYLSVGFVLIFMGKISKATLFENFHKGIAELNDRNSQELDSRASGPVQVVLQSAEVIPSLAVAQLWISLFLQTPAPADEMQPVAAPLACPGFGLIVLRGSRQALAP